VRVGPPPLRLSKSTLTGERAADLLAVTLRIHERLVAWYAIALAAANGVAAAAVPRSDPLWCLSHQELALLVGAPIAPILGALVVVTGAFPGAHVTPQTGQIHLLERKT